MRPTRSHSRRRQIRAPLRLNLAQALPPVLAAPMAEFLSLYPEASLRVTVTSRMSISSRKASIWPSGLFDARLEPDRSPPCELPHGGVRRPAYFARRGRPTTRYSWRSTIACSFTIRCGAENGASQAEREQVVAVSGNLETNSVVAMRMAAMLGEVCCVCRCSWSPPKSNRAACADPDQIHALRVFH